MGFDWVVEAKEENGRVIEPEETAGRKYLSKNDPESVELFRKIYEEKHAELKDPGPPPVPIRGPGGFAALREFFSDERRQRRYENNRNRVVWLRLKEEYECWNRPFEQVLDDFANAEKPCIVRLATDDKQDALAAYLGPWGYYDFRCGILSEDKNDVGRYAAEEMGMSYLPAIFQEEFTLEDMLELADTMEKALISYKSNVTSQHADSVDEVESAIRWLRFWASHGHTIGLNY